MTDYAGFTTVGASSVENCVTSSLGQIILAFNLPFQITSDYPGLTMQSVGAGSQGITYAAFQNLGASSVPKQGDSNYGWAKVSVVTTSGQSNVGVQHLPTQTIGQIWPR